MSSAIRFVHKNSTLVLTNAASESKYACMECWAPVPCARFDQMRRVTSGLSCWGCAKTPCAGIDSPGAMLHDLDVRCSETGIELAPLLRGRQAAVMHSPWRASRRLYAGL